MFGWSAMFMKIVSLVVFSVCLVQGREITDHLDAKLKLINKPALKSFQIENGDIIDCIDIHKQLAFDHPMLKNHKIQMKPETVLQETTHNKLSNYMPENIVCPPESVPIKRATREDLIMSESIKKSKGLKNPSVNPLSLQENAVDPRGHAHAVLVARQRSYGAKVVLNIWNPEVGNQQYSLGGLGLAIGPFERITTIQAGWLVHGVISPKDSRLFTFWTSNGYQSGCFNTLCPGFVQVSTEIILGLVLQSSTYAGPQTEISLSVYQDRSTRDWWLMVNGKYVGYWPVGVVSGMTDGADIAWWGGEAYTPQAVLSPPMGSGHFPDEGSSKTAYAHELRVLNKAGNYIDPSQNSLLLWVTQPKCYNAIPHFQAGYFIDFGGPGHCNF